MPGRSYPDPLTRPPVWVLHQGVWCRGRLLGWIAPGESVLEHLRDGWAGHVRWHGPSGLQHEMVLPEGWLADGGLPAPEVPAGVVGFVPPPLAV